MIGINGRYSTRFTRYWETTIGHKSIHMPLHSSATQLVDIENNSSFLIPGEFPESVTRSEIRRLLQDIPKPKEIRYWLRHFAQAKSRAIIKVNLYSAGFLSFVIPCIGISWPHYFPFLSFLF